MLDWDAVERLPTKRPQTSEFLRSVKQFFAPERFAGYRTSRTVRACQLPMADIARAVEMGKMELCPPADMITGKRLPEGVHAVNVFAVHEMKGRRRLITEPGLNACIDTAEIPRVQYPSRLARRQALRASRYLLQIDFEAFYDAIPIPPSIRNCFVFRARDGRHYRLRTLPTGARWSVAVGQAVTWAIVDIDTPVCIMSMIDNILIAGREGQEEAFVGAVRTILERIRHANLLTSPDREWLAELDDDAILQMASGPDTFLGEEFLWNGRERLVRNSAKSVAKLTVALRKQSFTFRSFASVLSLIFYMLHTTRLNPAKFFVLARAYSAAARMIHAGYDWDDEHMSIAPHVMSSLRAAGARLIENPWDSIASDRTATYDDADYDVVCFTDASLGGWGAYAHRHSRSTLWYDAAGRPRYAEESLTAYQQRWNNELDRVRRLRVGPVITGSSAPVTEDRGYFMAKHSAHAEPHAAELLLRQLVAEGLPNGSRVAVATDHFAIVNAQKHHNGFGGIGRGFALNKLYEYTYDLYYEKDIDVVFFYVAGKLNPADELSRNFGDGANGVGTQLTSRVVNDVALPLLECTFSPLCEEQ